MNTVCNTVMFVWRDKTGISSVELHTKTFEECLKIAKEFGYTPSVWYKPSTWSNTHTCWPAK